MYLVSMSKCTFASTHKCSAYPGAFGATGHSGGWLGCIDRVVKVGGVLVCKEVITEGIQFCAGGGEGLNEEGKHAWVAVM